MLKYQHQSSIWNSKMSTSNHFWDLQQKMVWNSKSMKKFAQVKSSQKGCPAFQWTTSSFQKITKVAQSLKNWPIWSAWTNVKTRQIQTLQFCLKVAILLMLISSNNFHGNIMKENYLRAPLMLGPSWYFTYNRWTVLDGSQWLN